MKTINPLEDLGLAPSLTNQDRSVRPRLGSLQVNSTDYDGDIVIEQFSYWGFNQGPSWAVPAWDEGGSPELGGPFASHAEAQLALDGWVGQ